jgi:hypothetical protein
MRVAWALAALALVAAGEAPAHEPDRRERFADLARQYADAPDTVGAGPLLSSLFEIVDDEILDNLRAGGLFASAAFIQERLQVFSDEWGGVAFSVARLARGRDTPALGLFALTRAEPRGSLRIYGRLHGRVSRLAAVTHEGRLEVHPWPAAPDGGARFLASWLGAPGWGKRALHLELWRESVTDGVRRIWSSSEAFPGGLRVTDFTARDGRIRVRYELAYPGAKPGCDGETEQEDVYGPAAQGEGLVLTRRRALNGWHRELQSAVTRFFGALEAGDRSALVELVPDATLRARLPRELRPDAVCDQRGPGAAGTVIVAATREREQRRVPWSLAWRRAPGGWRLTAATPVLQ